MTKSYSAKRLLEHGALKLDKFHEITGWQYWECREVLGALVDTGEVVKPARGLYQLAG